MSVPSGGGLLNGGKIGVNDGTNMFGLIGLFLSNFVVVGLYMGEDARGDGGDLLFLLFIGHLLRGDTGGGVGGIGGV